MKITLFRSLVAAGICSALCFVLLSCGAGGGDADINTKSDVAVIDDGEPQSKTEARENGEKRNVRSLDIYIIAGQSNAAGYTKINESVLSALWSQYKQGSSSVLYNGRAEYTENVGTPEVSTGAYGSNIWVNARAGQGRGKEYMGPEVGMASVLSDEYYDGVSKTAGIIKFAHGGTSLLNKVGGENAASGNWVSPSYAEYLGVEYSGLTGGLYRALLEQVSNSVSRLEGKGYDEISIKGLFWMQGESDKSEPSEYSVAFKYFANDIRRDLGRIMNREPSELAIMIGEISETSGSASASAVQTNKRFIAMQRTLAEELGNTYVIASGQYKIAEWINGADAKDVYQNDTWHWNTEKMFRIGELVGECIVKDILSCE